jgi:hypothetical protein
VKIGKTEVEKNIFDNINHNIYISITIIKVMGINKMLREDINILNQQRHLLMRSFDREEMNEDEYNQKVLLLNQQINELNIQIINELNEKRKEVDKEYEERRNKMVEEKIKEVKEKKERVSKPRENSRGNTIIEVLQMKSVKNKDVAADKVIEKMPGENIKNVKSQISAIIKLVKDQKGRFSAYSWDDANFQLTVK